MIAPLNESGGQVWVTADDFGMSPRANREIIDLAQCGALTAVSVMMSRSACLDGLADLCAAPVMVGLHAMFTDGLALSSGRLPRAWWSLTPRLLSGRSSARLAIELDAQAERLIELTGRLDFINSHEHVHLLPSLWPAVVRAASRHRVTAIRSPSWPPRGRGPQAAIAWMGALARHRAPAPAGVTLTNPVGVLQAGRLNQAQIDSLLERHPPRADAPTELCCHPVTGRGPTPELALLANGTLDRMLADRGLVRVRVGAS